MKVCPICKARTFEDMEICYNCLHKFEDDVQEAQTLPHTEIKPLVEEGDVVDFLSSYYDFLGAYLKKVK